MRDAPGNRRIRSILQPREKEPGHCIITKASSGDLSKKIIV